MDSPLPNLAILVFYLYFVRKGPEWMKDRQPFQLRNLLIFYNFALVGLSLYMLREVSCFSIDFFNAFEGHKIVLSSLSLISS